LNQNSAKKNERCGHKATFQGKNWLTTGGRLGRVAESENALNPEKGGANRKAGYRKTS